MHAYVSGVALVMNVGSATVVSADANRWWTDQCSQIHRCIPNCSQ